MPLAFRSLLFIGIAALSAGPARATIVDTGDVTLTGNDLVIGNAADGSRTVAAESDGPYDSATLGVASGVTGTLSLDDATFTTTGTFTAGVEGDAVVDLRNGSTLETGDAALRAATIALDGGSSWINDGAITYDDGFNSVHIQSKLRRSPLEVVLAAGYLPTPGDVFEVLRTGARVGEFESYSGLDLGGGLSLVPEYGPDSLVLHAVPEPTTALLVALGLMAVSLARTRGRADR